MKQEKLFTALADVGDDLLDMAQNKRFVNPWKRWGKIAACLAVVICLTALALPYFPMGCGSSMQKGSADMAVTMENASEAAEAEEKPMEDLAAGEAAPVEEEAPAETPAMSPETEEKLEQDVTAEKTMTKFVVCGTYYYLERQYFVPLDTPPRELGEELGTVSAADLPDLVGCTVYRQQYSAVFDRYAVDGQAVTQNVWVKTADGYVHAVTVNEKIVSRYSLSDVIQAAQDEQWLLDTFVRPLEEHGRGEIQFTDASRLTADQLNQLVPAFVSMNMGVTVSDFWMEGDQLVIPVSDAQFRLWRFLTGLTYDPVGTGDYDPERSALVFPAEVVLYDDSVELTLEDVEEVDGQTLRLTVFRQDGVRRVYTICFDEDSWRYESIVEK